MRNNIPAAAYTLAALLIFAAVAVPALGSEDNSDVIRKILDLANAEAGGKLQELQQNGIPVPLGAAAFYSAALTEREAAIKALDTGDIASAETHAINAMDLFKSLFDLLGSFEQDGDQDIELANSIDAEISDSQAWSDELKELAGVNNVSADFADYDSAIIASLDALAEGDLTEAEKQLELAWELLEEIHDDIQAAADSKKDGKAREFAQKAADRLKEIAEDAKESDLFDSEFIEELENKIEQLENATDIDEIIELTDDSSELQEAIDEHNIIRVKNFDNELVNIEQDIAMLYAAAEELDRLDSLLHDIEDVIEEFSSVMEDVDGTVDIALALRSQAENIEELEQIDQAISLLDEADAALMTAAEIGLASGTIDDVYAQLELASILADEADQILDEIGGDLGDFEKELESIIETIAEYEDWANELMSEALEADNAEAIGSIDEALTLIQLAGDAASEGDIGQAQSYLHDAQLYLENAEAILASEEEQGEGSGDEGSPEEEQGYENYQEYHIRENSWVILQVNEGAGEIELGIQMEPGDIDPGMHDVEFVCQSPEIDLIFEGALEAVEGEAAGFSTWIQLNESVYEGCNISFETISIDFDPFEVTGQHEENGNEGSADSGSGAEDSGSEEGAEEPAEEEPPAEEPPEEPVEEEPTG